MFLPVDTISCSWPALLSLSSVTVMLIGCKEEHRVTEAPTPVRVQGIEVEAATEAGASTGVVRTRHERRTACGNPMGHPTERSRRLNQ
jgi:hypothetical protein